MKDCLQKIDDMSLVIEAKELLGGETLLQFVSSEYAARAEEVYAHIGSPRLSGSSIWGVFSAMLPIMLSNA
jgi:hypothetical protein